MNQYVYTVQPVRLAMLDLPTDEEASALAHHQAYQQSLMDSGVGILGGALAVSDSRQFGLFIFTAQDDEQAKAIMGADPAIQARVLRGCIYPYRISLWNIESFRLGTNPSYFIYLIQPSRPEMLTAFSDFEAQTMSAHFMYLQELTKKEQFCLAGPCLNTDYSNFGIGILRADNIERAWAVSEHDPAVQNRIMRLDVQPFDLQFINESYVHAR